MAMPEASSVDSPSLLLWEIILRRSYANFPNGTARIGACWPSHMIHAQQSLTTKTDWYPKVKFPQLAIVGTRKQAPTSLASLIVRPLGCVPSCQELLPSPLSKEGQPCHMPIVGLVLLSALSPPALIDSKSPCSSDGAILALDTRGPESKTMTMMGFVPGSGRRC